MRGISVSILLALATPALAAPATDAAADAALQDGRRLYNVQDWDAAIAKFKDAYKLRPDAASLFNIAQSYRLKGDCAAAAIQYRTYRRNYPNERNIDKVETFIVDMDACAAKANPAPVVAPAPAPDPPVTQPRAPAEPPPPAKASPALRWGGVAAIGIGAVGLGLGVKFALDGRSAEDDLAKACAVSCTSAQALGIESDGHAANTKTVVFSAIGGAAVIGGVIMLVLSRGGSSETARVSITPTAGGATAAYGFAF